MAAVFGSNAAVKQQVLSDLYDKTRLGVHRSVISRFEKPATMALVGGKSKLGLLRRTERQTANDGEKP